MSKLNFFLFKEMWLLQSSIVVTFIVGCVPAFFLLLSLVKTSNNFM